MFNFCLVIKTVLSIHSKLCLDSQWINKLGFYLKLMSIKQTQNLIHCSSMGKIQLTMKNHTKGLIYLFICFIEITDS